ncbi:unnamed protein product, partial [Rotaria sp. Silwood1]
MDIVKQLEQLIQSKHIIFSTSISDRQLVSNEKQKIIKISNSFIDNYLKPIFSTNNQWTFDIIDRDDNSSARYEGKYHWHVYKEVGDEISRVRNNDDGYRNSNKYRYRTKGQQR